MHWKFSDGVVMLIVLCPALEVKTGRRVIGVLGVRTACRASADRLFSYFSNFVSKAQSG